MKVVRQGEGGGRSMKWSEGMVKLIELSSMVADEKLEKTGMFGVLHFFDDGWVWGSNGFFEFELYCGSEFNVSVPASKFYDVMKVLDPKLAYEVWVDGGHFVVTGEGVQVKLNVVQSDGVVNRITSLLKSDGSGLKGVQVDWSSDVLKVLKREEKVASSGSSALEYRVICFDRQGIFATDRVRIACYFAPFIVGEEKVLLSVSGVKQLVRVAEDAQLEAAWVVGDKLCAKFGGGLYVGVLGYDMDYPKLGEVLSGYKEKVEVMSVDMLVTDEISRIIKILDPSDVVYLVVDGGWLELKVNSLRGFEWGKKLQKVPVDGHYEVGVLARDLDGVIDGVVELGFSDNVVYCKSVEGVEYVIATIS